MSDRGPFRFTLQSPSPIEGYAVGKRMPVRFHFPSGELVDLEAEITGFAHVPASDLPYQYEITAINAQTGEAN